MYFNRFLIWLIDPFFNRIDNRFKYYQNYLNKKFLSIKMSQSQMPVYNIANRLMRGLTHTGGRPSVTFRSGQGDYFLISMLKYWIDIWDIWILTFTFIYSQSKASWVLAHLDLTWILALLAYTKYLTCIIWTYASNSEYSTHITCIVWMVQIVRIMRVNTCYYLYIHVSNANNTNNVSICLHYLYFYSTWILT